MSESIKSLKNFLNFSIGPIGNALIGAISVPITTRLLVPEDFGKSSMYAMVKGMAITIVLMGFDYSLMREYGESNDKPELLRNSLVVPLVILTLFGIVSVGFRSRISTLLFDENVSHVILLLVFQLFLEVFIRYSELVLRMSEKARLFSFFQILMRILSFVFTITFLLLLRRSYLMIIYGQILAYLFVFFALLWSTREAWVLFGKVDVVKIKVLAKLGLPVVPSTLLFWVIQSMDKIALRKWSGFVEVGYYAGALKIVALFEIIRFGFSIFWTPTILRWQREAIEIKMINDSIRIVSLFISAAGMLVVIMRHFLIRYLGSEFQPSVSLIPWLLFLPVMAVMGEIYSSGITFQRKSHYISFVFLVMSVLNVSLNLLLVPRYNALGASLATAVTYLAHPIMFYVFSRKVWGEIKSLKSTLNILTFVTVAVLSLLDHKIIAYFQIAMLVLLIVLNNKIIIKIVFLGYRYITKTKKHEKY